MGQIFSKKKRIATPYEFLNVNELSTLSTYKKAYQKIFFNNQKDIDLMAKVNESYKYVTTNVELNAYYVLFKKVLTAAEDTDYSKHRIIKKINSTKKEKSKEIGGYDEELNIWDNKIKVFKENDKTYFSVDNETTLFNFSTICSDFFAKLASSYEIKCPPCIDDTNFVGFYNYWNRFSSNDKILEAKVRKIVKMIKDNDPRFDSKIENKIKKEPITDKSIKPLVKIGEKKKKQWKVQCIACNKGFNNRNTLNDHLKSKKHLNSVDRFDGNPIIKNEPFDDEKVQCAEEEEDDIIFDD